MEGWLPTPPQDALGDWAAERCVSATVSTANAAGASELTLSVRAARGYAAAPTDPDCYGDWKRLCALVARAVDGIDRRCELEPFDRSFHLRRETGWAPEIQVSAAFRMSPSSRNAEPTRAAQLLKRLRQLGVHTS